MTVRMERVNLRVGDTEGMIGILRTAFPEFLIRFDGVGEKIRQGGGIA